VPSSADITNGGDTYFMNDVAFEPMNSSERSMIPKPLKQNRLLLPPLLYSFLFTTFMPRDVAETDVLFVYDAAPTLCTGLIAALEGSMLYTVPSGEPMPADHLTLLVNFILKTFDDETIQLILDDFEKRRPQLQIVQAPAKVRMGHRRASYA